LDEGTLAMLKAHRVKQTAIRLAAPAWQDNDLIFPSPRGRIVWVGFCNEELDRLCAAAGVPRLTMHGLRHTYITHALLRGESPHVIAARVGHTVAMMYQRYAHVIESQQEQAAEQAGRWLDEVERVHTG
jgi:integrase